MRASNRTRLYSQYRQEQVQEKLSQLGIFSYMDMQYAPRDTTAACDTLDVTMPVSYTHLDVYKRQILMWEIWDSRKNLFP